MKKIQVIKEKLNSGTPVNVEKLISILKSYEVISFDIFDTLLKRNVNTPIDVFKYVENKINKPGFAEKRIVSEKKARKKNIGKEISLEDIYAEFGEDYSKEEIDAESDLLIANDDLLPVFKYCIENKRVILTSDIYLPEYFILAILSREGIIGYEKLYLSSTIGLTKSSGKLFQYIIDDMGIEKNSLFHIGDSIKSDYIMPRMLNISAYHIPTYVKRAEYQILGDEIDKNVINSFINNTITKCADKYYRFGYEKYGMFLWGFSKWLHESVVHAEIEKVYFFSRDGLIMKNAFDSLFSDVKTYYLEVSRRALRVPILWRNYDFEHVLDMISPSKLISLSVIFDGVGLNIENYVRLLEEYGFDTNTSFDRKEILKNKQLIKMYRRLSSDIERVSKREYDFLVKYIKQNELKGSFAIVDIGWSGGMQRYLCETLDMIGIEYKIKGYYVGVADYFKRNKSVIPSLDLNGYLFDFSHDDNAVDKRSPFVGLFETLFLEQDGSVEKYIEEDGIIKGKRLNYEYLQNGKLTYEFDCVQNLQAGALDFVKKFGNKNIKLDAAALFAGIEETGLRPTKGDLRLFADLRFFDEGETHFLARPKSVLRYIWCKSVNGSVRLYGQ